MEGFRFWKQGFWKEHLRGKPYHISALFVVDLARFRSAVSLCIWLLALLPLLLCPVTRLLFFPLSSLLLAAAALLFTGCSWRRHLSEDTSGTVMAVV